MEQDLTTKMFVMMVLHGRVEDYAHYCTVSADNPLSVIMHGERNVEPVAPLSRLENANSMVYAARGLCNRVWQGQYTHKVHDKRYQSQAKH